MGGGVLHVGFPAPDGVFRLFLLRAPHPRVCGRGVVGPAWEEPRHCGGMIELRPARDSLRAGLKFPDFLVHWRGYVENKNATEGADKHAHVSYCCR